MNRILFTFVVVGIVIVFCDYTVSKQYTRCGLVNELNRKKFNRSFIGNWVCMIESESAKDTSKVTKKANGSTNYGIFQINDREWCKQGKAGGKCNIKCEDLLDDDINDDANCAKKIQEEIGFKNWDGWVRSCYQKNISYVTNCFK
ncbi:lysozyme isoform X2 [Onthophagus taurus]|uniref:lysozyme isoform X2 n=1 Tax=Onthophagus taurus TaxID=166361 RepID=UPI000C20D8DA|nr:lysozyme-like isoform X1 [Onthophagus taurus]